MSVRQRGNGTWEVRWREGGRAPSRTFATKQDAIEFDQQIKRQPARARSLRRPNVAFDQYAIVWMEHLGKQDIADSTIRRYATELSYTILPYAKQHRWTVASVLPRDLHDLVEQREKQGVAKGTRAKTVTVLRAMFRDAVILDYRVDNPALSLRAKQDSSRRRQEIPTMTEIEAAAAACSSDLVRLWLLTMAYTGARPSEAIGMRWEHIDRERKLITIGDQPVVEVGGRRVVKETAKSAAGTARRVPLLSRMEEVLDELEALRAEDQPWLFPGRRTKVAAASKFGSLPMSHEHARKRLREDCAAAEVPAPDPYDARHLYAALLIAAGLSAFKVTEFMGHRSIATTTRIYGHLLHDDLSQDGQQIEKALREHQASD